MVKGYTVDEWNKNKGKPWIITTTSVPVRVASTVRAPCHTTVGIEIDMKGTTDAKWEAGERENMEGVRIARKVVESECMRCKTVSRHPVDIGKRLVPETH